MIFKTKFFSALICTIMLVGFTACEKEQEPVDKNTDTDVVEKPNNNDSSNNDGSNDVDESDTSNGYKVMLIVNELEGATATVSKTSNVVFEDEIILTITRNYEEWIWRPAPTVEVTNAVSGKLEENDGIYTCTITGFTDNSVVTVKGRVVTFNSNSHEYVDLGLPSGILWATCNIGATTPTEVGSLFAWGETTTKSEYTRENYTYKENPDVLPLSADAAHVNWGGDWRMPIYNEMEELVTHCTWIREHNWGNYCRYKIIGPNENFIILPSNIKNYVIPEIGNAEYYSYIGTYWGANLSTSQAYASDIHFYFYEETSREERDISSAVRYQGSPIRPVCMPK